MAPDQAVSHCRNLYYAGSKDWRLPTVEELESIVDFGRIQPAIDTSVFPNTPCNSNNMPDSWFLTSTNVTGADGYAWYVSFYDGGIHPGDKTNQCYWRCVRMGPANLPDQRFIQRTYVNGEPIVMAMAAGRMWQKNYVSSQR